MAAAHARSAEAAAAATASAEEMLATTALVTRLAAERQSQLEAAEASRSEAAQRVASMQDDGHRQAVEELRAGHRHALSEQRERHAGAVEALRSEARRLEEAQVLRLRAAQSQHAAAQAELAEQHAAALAGTETELADHLHAERAAHAGTRQELEAALAAAAAEHEAALSAVVVHCGKYSQELAAVLSKETSQDISAELTTSPSAAPRELAQTQALAGDGDGAACTETALARAEVAALGEWGLSAAAALEAERGARAVASLSRSVLADIYLCAACSCQFRNNEAQRPGSGAHEGSRQEHAAQARQLEAAAEHAAAVAARSAEAAAELGAQAMAAAHARSAEAAEAAAMKASAEHADVVVRWRAEKLSQRRQLEAAIAASREVGQEMEAAAQQQDAVVTVSGLFHMLCGRFDWDLPICCVLLSMKSRSGNARGRL
eukprot:COSAG01_NODE_2861_length_6959_cov_3.530321_10_plen_434_part_01